MMDCWPASSCAGSHSCWEFLSPIKCRKHLFHSGLTQHLLLRFLSPFFMIVPEPFCWGMIEVDVLFVGESHTDSYSLQKAGFPMKGEPRPGGTMCGCHVQTLELIPSNASNLDRNNNYFIKGNVNKSEKLQRLSWCAFYCHINTMSKSNFWKKGFVSHYSL